MIQYEFSAVIIRPHALSADIIFRYARAFPVKVGISPSPLALIDKDVWLGNSAKIKTKLPDLPLQAEIVLVSAPKLADSGHCSGIAWLLLSFRRRLLEV